MVSTMNAACVVVPRDLGHRFLIVLMSERIRSMANERWRCGGMLRSMISRKPVRRWLSPVS